MKEDDEKETKIEFKDNRYTNTNREDVKMIKVNKKSKYDH